MSHDNFWSAVNKRVSATEFFFHEMGKDLLPPGRDGYTPYLSALRASGVILHHPWQERFYYHFDAFLAMGRSIPEIVQCLFGLDPAPPMRPWRLGLPQAESDRRHKFQSEFDSAYQTFRDLTLSGARNITLHRTGVAPIEVRIVGRWGTDYTGTPLEVVPASESIPTSHSNDPAWLWQSTQPPQLIEPKAEDFSLVVASGSATSKVKLFPECQAFIEAAKTLASDGRKISDRVHGTDLLTPPPS
jgi:hypothetical protein